MQFSNLKERVVVDGSQMETMEAESRDGLRVSFQDRVGPTC